MSVNKNYNNAVVGIKRNVQCHMYITSVDEFPVVLCAMNYHDMTLSQACWPMGAQLSLKAALPLAETIVTTLDHCSNTWLYLLSCETVKYISYLILLLHNLAASQLATKTLLPQLIE